MDPSAPKLKLPDQHMPPLPTPTVAQGPQVFSANGYQETPHMGIPQRRGFPVKILAIGIGLLFVVGMGTVGVAVAAAYGKLSLNNDELQHKVIHIVQGLPFMPKTPEFILQKAALVHTKVAKHSFDVSLAAQADGLNSQLGISQFDVAAKGAVDYTDQKNLKGQVAIDITKDFQMEIRKPDSTVYFKVNKLPAMLLTAFGIEEAKIAPVLENWIAYDTTPLQTEARQTLDAATADKNTLTQEYISSLVDELNDDQLLDAITVSEEAIDGSQSHKLSLVTTDQMVDKIYQRIENRLEGTSATSRRASLSDVRASQMIKDLVIEVWVDKQDYYIRKVSTKFTYDPNVEPQESSDGVLGITDKLSIDPEVLGIEDSLFGLGQNTFSVAMVVKFNDFGTDVSVETPEKSIKPEEALKLLVGDTTILPFGGTQTPDELEAQDRDLLRMSELAHLQSTINIALQDVAPSGEEILCHRLQYPCYGMSTSTAARNKNGTGWVKVNFNQTIVTVPTLPIDPINTQLHHYSYCATTDHWEINTVLESARYQSSMRTDDGDDPTKYEVGTNLKLIDNTVGCTY